MMRRILGLTALLLLLSGCAQNVEPDALPTQVETTVPPETGCYVADSPVERATDGAVELYDLPELEYLWMECCGDRLLLASKTDGGRMTEAVGSGVDLCLSDTQLTLFLDRVYRQSTRAGLALYDPQTSDTVFFRPGLQSYVPEISPIEGNVLFSEDGNNLYYCQGGEIRVIDLGHGITRMLKTHSCKSQSLIGIYFNGAVLGCRVTAEDGSERTLFISAQTGQTLAEDIGFVRMYSRGDAFVAFRQEGIAKHCLYGTRNGIVQCLNLSAAASVLPLLELNSVLTYEAGEQGLQLNLYGLSTGTLAAQLTLEGIGEPKSIRADENGNAVWLLAQDPATGEDALYRWQYQRTKADEEVLCAAPYYTADAPDEVGLEQLEELAEELGDNHGVDIRIWQDAVGAPGEYTLEAEHQTRVIEETLTELDAALSQYPEKFLYKSVNRYLRICIVRSISQEIKGVQYWYDGDAYIVLAAGCDVAGEFLRGMGYVVDSHVLGNSPLVDTWAGLNPEGFVYGQAQDALLAGESRAFADGESMASVVEDRARLFYYAMTKEQGDLFSSTVMQAKLKQLCLGIRDAWRWEKVKETFPWEQYLLEPVAPV